MVKLLCIPPLILILTLAVLEEDILRQISPFTSPSLDTGTKRTNRFSHQKHFP